jgi:uncharacterized OsmC-like protein
MAKKNDKHPRKKDKHDKKRDKNGSRKQLALKGLKTAVDDQDDKPTDVIRPTLREVQTALKQGYRDDPESALITSAAYSTTLADAEDPTRVRIAVDGPNGVVLEIGAHVAVGGEEDLACSGDIFLASLVACQELTIRLVAASMEIALAKLDVRVEGDWDVRGTLAVSRESPIGFSAIRVLVKLDADAPADKLERLLSSAERFCVVSATLKDPPPIEMIATIQAALDKGFMEEIESE